MCVAFALFGFSHSAQLTWGKRTMNVWMKSFKGIAFHRTNVCLLERSFLPTYISGAIYEFLPHTHKHKAADNERTIKRFLNQTYSVEIGTCIKHTHAPALDIIWIYRKAYNILADIRHSSKVIQNKRHYDPSLFVYICYHIRIMSRWL